MAISSLSTPFWPGGMVSVKMICSTGAAFNFFAASRQRTPWVFKNVAFALQYNYFSVDVDVDDSDWMGSLKYEYRGPVLAIAVYF